MSKRLTKEEIVERARKVHGDKYDYSEFLKKDFEYKEINQRIPIICHEKDENGNEHGIFTNTVRDHTGEKHAGCQKCSLKRRGKLTSERLKGTHQDQQEWIEYCKKKHNDKYDYSLVDFDNKRDDGAIPIICHELDEEGNEHGVFWQNPSQHKWGKGCKKCTQLTTAKFLKKVSDDYKKEYDLSLVKYVGTFGKVNVICKTCGKIFPVTPHNLLKGRGCPFCRTEKIIKKLQLSVDEVKKRIDEKFGGKYALEKIVYRNINTPIIVTCPIHGDFEQTPYMLFNGHGCYKCGQSALENEIQVFLDSKKIESKYEANKRYFSWLGMQSLDFYLPQYNVAIECQGIQHFKPQHFGGESDEDAKQKFKETIRLDEQKRKLCEEHGIKLLYYSNLGIEYPYKVFENKENLLNEILNYNESNCRRIKEKGTLG